MQAEVAKRLREEKDEKRLEKLTQLYMQLKKEEQDILRKGGTVIVKES